MRRVVVLVVGLLVLQATPASAAPDVVKRAECGDGVRARLKLDDVGDRVRMRFVLHGSAPGDRWTMWIHRSILTATRSLILHGTRVAAEDGEVVMRKFFSDTGPNYYRVTARDWQTGQECDAAGSLSDEVDRATCRGVQPRAQAHLELTRVYGRIVARFVLHQMSLPGHRWRVVLKHAPARCCAGPDADDFRAFFEGTKLASGERGDITVRRSVRSAGYGVVTAKARDRQTGQFCRVRRAGID
jgi:hypothetical protein